MSSLREQIVTERLTHVEKLSPTALRRLLDYTKLLETEANTRRGRVVPASTSKNNNNSNSNSNDKKGLTMEQGHESRCHRQDVTKGQHSSSASSGSDHSADKNNNRHRHSHRASVYYDASPNSTSNNNDNAGRNTNTSTSGAPVTPSGTTTSHNHPAASLANQLLLDKIDALRELRLGSLVSLPQLVVVGDQSSGKSSVLESLTGFSFPRATGLCTRYATQITCRREAGSVAGAGKKRVEVSIIPRPDADDALKARLRAFRRSVENLDGNQLAVIFEDANRVMGIRPSTSSTRYGNDDDDDMVNFSEDILKIEIHGPDQPALTVIDVPGIFRTATPGLTTETDISLVTTMVKSYMKDPRTIILAVIPCNVDIATQEILKLAKDADPQGVRTMGVLTKPDLAPERATQQAILDLIGGKWQDLKLGYCVVKNRGADDKSSNLRERDAAEKAFFRQEPWGAVAASSKRIGVEALKVRLRELLMNISKREFPKVQAEIRKQLATCRKQLDAMGVSRSDEKSQRAYLGKIAATFERIVSYALNAYYTEDPIFDDRLEMRLITRVIELNEVLGEVFSIRGHTRHFSRDNEDSKKDSDGDKMPKLSFEVPEVPDELLDLLPDEPFECPAPSSESILTHIEDIFKKSRGPELGTFGGALLGTIFKEQSRRWEPLILSHVSSAILVVHQFIIDLLAYVFGGGDDDDEAQQVCSELYENVLVEKLQASYKQAMDHARFLLEIEREGKPTTYNTWFNDELQRGQGKRLGKKLEESAVTTGDGTGTKVINLASALAAMSMGDKSNPRQATEYLHDVLKSYYQVSAKRFVDVVCQQVVNHFLLNGKGSPLHVFSTELVLDLSAGTLEMIAGEDQVTRQERERLAREIDSLQAAMQVLRG